MLLQSFISCAQCKDFFNNKVDCPTLDDSLIVYNNAILVYEYYENNKSYIKSRSQELVTISDKTNIYQSLEDAKRMFFVIRKELKNMSNNDKKFLDAKPSIKYKDITFKDYYQEIDEYRFYEREMENQIININAPIPMYDTRIAPILINEYKNIDSSDVYFGDLVNLPLYIPVIVKPYSLLTSTELALRNQLLKIVPNNVIRHSIKRELVKAENNIPTNGSPIYAYSSFGSGALIGFLVNRKFVKISPLKYEIYAVPFFAIELLKNDQELDKMLKIRFGGYYLGLY